MMTAPQAVHYFLGREVNAADHVADLIEAGRIAKQRRDAEQEAVNAIMLALCHHMSVREIEAATGWPKTTVHTYARAGADALGVASQAVVDSASGVEEATE